MIDNRYIEITFENRDDGGRSVVLQRIGNTDVVHKIKLTEAEWMRMYDLMLFFNALTLWYKASANDVKTYYTHYLKQCTDTNRICLTTHEFFTPNDIPNQFYVASNFNYTRLFYEIGIFCRHVILDTCIQKLYS